MGHVLMAANPAVGHVLPLTTVAASLVKAGHEVDVVTGSGFAAAVSATGARFHPLLGDADYDLGDPDGPFAAISRIRDPVELMNAYFERGHAAALPGQHQALQPLVRADTVAVYDGYFTGFWPELPGAPVRRARQYLAIGMTPLMLPSDNTRTAHAALLEALTPGTAAIQDALRSLGADGASMTDYFSAAVTLPDAFAQLTVPEFELPRAGAPPGLRFVGPLPAPAGGPWERPDWWRRLDDDRPVVVVTQGTLANRDLSELLLPALEALSARDVTVVACLGRDPADLGPVPDNAVAVRFAPFDELLPRADVLVTNGGYGGTQLALAHGLPLVVGGTTEDKAAVAARITHAGVGIDLGTSTPSPRAIAAAVDDVLAQPTYRNAAHRLATRYRAVDGLRRIVDMVAGMLDDT